VTSKLTDNYIVDNTISGVKIADGTIASSKLVGGGAIPDNSILNVKLVDKTVTNAKIADGTIINSLMANGSVGAGNLIDSAVTEPKIANGVITPAKLDFTPVKGSTTVKHVSNNTEYIAALNSLTAGDTVMLQPGSYDYGGSYNLTVEAHFCGYAVADSRNVVIVHDFTVAGAADLSSFNNLSFNIPAGNLTINNPNRVYFSDCSIRDTCRIQNVGVRWCIFDRCFILTLRIDDFASASEIVLNNCFVNSITNNLLPTSAPRVYISNSSIPFPPITNDSYIYKGAISNRADLSDFRLYTSAGKFYQDQGLFDAEPYLTALNTSKIVANSNLDLLNTYKITNMAAPTSAGDAVTKLYYDTNTPFAGGNNTWTGINTYQNDIIMLSSDPQIVQKSNYIVGNQNLFFTGATGIITSTQAHDMFICCNNTSPTYNSAKTCNIGLNYNGIIKIGDSDSSSPCRLVLGNAGMDADIIVKKQIDMTSNKIIQVATPTLGTDAANKDYVDSQVGGASLPDKISALAPALRALSYVSSLWFMNASANYLKNNNNALFIRDLGMMGKALRLGSVNSPVDGTT